MTPTPIQNLLVAFLAAGLLSGCGKKEDAIVPAPPVAVSTTNQPTPLATSNADFAKLPGKWLRPDGGYILEIRSVAPDGKMEAAYFNPRPIHVAKAEASQEGGSVKVFLELRVKVNKNWRSSVDALRLMGYSHKEE